MIISFSCQNFRSIREKVTLDFQASPDKHQREFFVVDVLKPRLKVLKTAMIYGANASGKTNILMALDALRRIVNYEPQNKEVRIPVQPYVLDSGNPSVFDISFIAGGILYEYHLEVDKKSIRRELLNCYPKGLKALVYDRELIDDKSNQYEYNWRGSEFTSQQEKVMGLLLQNRTVISGVGTFLYNGPINEVRLWFLETLNTLIYPKTDLFQHYLSKYVLPNDESTYAFFVDQLKKADFQISGMKPKQTRFSLVKTYETGNDIRIQTSDVTDNERTVTSETVFNNLHFTHQYRNETYKLDYRDESMGTQRYFVMIGLLLDLLAGKIILIDEVESSMHNDLVIHFISSFLKNSARGQLIFTSHNTALLNEKEIIRRDCVWITDRKEDGSTELTRVSAYPVRKEHALDSLFKKGLIGGKPNLGPIEIEDIPNGQTL